MGRRAIVGLGHATRYTFSPILTSRKTALGLPWDLPTERLCGMLWGMDLAQNITHIRERIAAACARAGRDPASVALMAVSKTHPPEAVRAAAELGLTLFGESKVQEAKGKIPLCPGRLHWHLIGHLQTNKCRDAVQSFEMIQSVDSLHLAEELQKQCDRMAKTMPILLEVNVAAEASKFGYKAQTLLDELKALNALPRLEIHGLMAIPPWSPDPERSRASFQRVSDLQKQCQDILGAPLTQLSLGMSGDFEVAIEEGATMVRIGSLLFGERPKREE